MLQNILRKFGLQQPAAATSIGSAAREQVPMPTGEPIGVIAGNGAFPIQFTREARKNNRPVFAVAHRGESLPELEQEVDKIEWIKVGELGRMIDFFKRAQIREVAMAGGINRVRLFGGVKLDARGAALLLRLRSTKDDVIMRGIASEIESEGMKMVPCTMFLTNCLAREGVLTKTIPSDDERRDIQVGIDAIKAMSGQDIGQLVVVREGVVVAVEAVEGSDKTILRGGELGGKGTVVVKCAKPNQDMRFDVPTVGQKTIQTMIQAGARVLALESGRCLIMEEPQVVSLADQHGISIVGCASLL